MKKSIVKKLFILAAVVMVLSWFLPGAALAAPPAAPSGLIAITINGGRVDVHWHDNSPDETGFNVYRAPDIGGLEPGPYSVIATVAENVTTYMDTSVMGSTAYWYYVAAVNADGLSFPSNEVRIYTPPSTPQISLTQPANDIIQSGTNNVVEAMTNVAGGNVALAEFQFIADNQPGVFDAHDILNPPMDLTIPTPRAASPANNTNTVPALLPAGAICEFEIRGTVASMNAGTGTYQIGSPALTVYDSVSTVYVGSRAPMVNDAVKIIAYRTAADGPLVAKSISYIAPAQPMGAPAVTLSFLLNGALASITDPVSGPGYLLSGEIWNIGTGMFRVDSQDFPAYIDPAIGIGTSVTVRFADKRAPANIARNIFKQITTAIGITTDPNPVFDDTDVPLGAPAGTWIYVIVDGVVSGLDLITGTWTIGTENIKCYQDANTLVAPATYGDEVLLYGRRTMTPGPIVLEQVHNILPGRLIATFKGTAQEMHLMYNGVIQNMNQNTWTVGGQTFVVDDNEGKARIDPLPYPSFNLGNLVTVEFERVGEVLPDPALWESLGPGASAGMWTGSLNLPEVARDGTGTLFLRVKDLGSFGSTSAQPVTLKHMPTSPPLAPSNLSASIISGTEIDLTWTDNADNEDGYYIGRTADNGNTWDITALPMDSTAFNDMAAVPGSTYIYQAAAYNVLGVTESNMVTVQFMTPTAPSNLMLSGGTAQVDLTWTDNSLGESGFTIERNPGVNDVPGWGTIGTNAADDNTYTDSTVTAGTLYSYRVGAFNIIGSSATSNEPSITTTGAPAQPTLSATLVSGTQIDLSWMSSSPVVDGFRLQRNVNNAGWVSILDPTTDTSYSDMDVAADNSYQYRVYAFNVIGDSPASEIVAVSTFLPTAPAGVMAQVTGTQKISVSWTAGGAEVNGYSVWKSVNSGAFAQIGTTTAATTTFDDIDVAVGNNYTYHVIANSVVGSSPASADAMVDFTAPAAPTLDTASAAATGEVDLAWTDNSLNETGFYVMRGTDNVNLTQMGMVGAGVTTYSDTAVLPETSYWYEIVAFNGLGESAPSDMVMVMTATPSAAPADPTDLAATAPAYNMVNLGWMDNSNNEIGFRIARATSASGTYTQLATVPINTTTYADNGLTASTTYYYVVTAYNNAGDSGVASANVTTPAQPIIPTGGVGGGGGGGGGLSVSLSGLTSTLTLSVDGLGYALTTAELRSAEQDCMLTIPINTRMLTASNSPLRQITHSHGTAPASPPEGYAIVGSVHNFGPTGATFSPTITLRLIFNPSSLPTGVTENMLSAATWDGNSWEFLSGDLNTTANSIAVKVGHFSTFVVLAELPAAPPATTTTPPPAVTTTPPAVTTPPPPAQTTTPAPAPPPAQTTTPAPAPPPAQTTTSPTPAATDGGLDWPLIGGIVGGVIVIGLIVIILVARRRY